MKKIIGILSVFVGIFLISATAKADSPLTSTQFSEAYQDIDLVAKAGESGIINSDIADYLADEANPIDVKAAMINALSWSIDGKDNANTYCQLIYGKSLEEMDLSSLSGDQQFCVGYLLALDDYFNTDQALELLTMSQQKMKESFTVAIIQALVESMDLLPGEWEEHIEPLLSDSGLTMDMRPEAENIILDYMISYSTGQGSEQSNDIPQTGVLSFGSLFGLAAFVSAVGGIFLKHKKCD
ncbi:MAG TPA: hypothetical protein VN258_16370 [Mobilitalea sp.]|nr:hypothetical protein [Mobilitalea sp.]